MGNRYTDYQGYVCSDWLNDVDWLLVESAGLPRTAVELRNNIGAIEEAPIDGGEYVRQDGGWVANSGGGGTIAHNSTTGRDTPDCHPTAAITGLDATLALKLSDAPVDGNYYVRKDSFWEVLPSSGGDPINHNETNNRSVADCHPTAAITGLDTALAAKADVTYVDAGLATKADATDLDNKVDEAPADGKTYGRKDAAWSELDLTGGGTVTAALANLAMNSGFKVNQRNVGTKQSNGGTAMGPDRWAFKYSGLGYVVGTLLKGSSASAYTMHGCNALAMKQSQNDGALGSTNLAVIKHMIAGEQWDQLNWNGTGADVTLSFRASYNAAEGAAFTMSVGIMNAAEDYCWLTTVTLTSVSQRFEITIPAPPAGTWGTGTSQAANLFFTFIAGSAHQRANLGAWEASGDYAHTTQSNLNTASTQPEIYIADVKLEQGDNATPYQVDNYATEILKCQRFYNKQPQDGSDMWWETAMTDLSRLYRRNLGYQYPVPMRADPTATVLGEPVNAPFASGFPKVTAITTSSCKFEGDMSDQNGYSWIRYFTLDSEYTP